MRGLPSGHRGHATASKICLVTGRDITLLEYNESIA